MFGVFISVKSLTSVRGSTVIPEKRGKLPYLAAE